MDLIVLKDQLYGLFQLLRSDVRIHTVIDIDFLLLRNKEDNCYCVSYKMENSYVTYAKVIRLIENGDLAVIRFNNGENTLRNYPDGENIERTILDILNEVITDYNGGSTVL